MSWRGKRKDEDDHASGGDSEGHAPPKKASKRDTDSDSSDDITVCEISKNRRVSVRNWNGKVVVDIREFYVKDGKQMPGKKGNKRSREGQGRDEGPVSQGCQDFPLGPNFGNESPENSNWQYLKLALGISLTMDQWNVLRNHVEEIDKAVNETS
ncbi:hypothetical protein DVH24_023344 [Malus domestica]|uniref:Transcriptional coactivator p15 (PC4) C-terminal domain-containing protein n=1 Tax=Malus domestica TaxID=3750 RepID=A0A498KW72_MALDO|nr:hypothetical protein DVH24_023344 [Malus domestica]